MARSSVRRCDHGARRTGEQRSDAYADPVELIRLGSVGPEVEDVQRRLENLGLPCSGDPRVFDHQTEAAVRAFQQRRGLIADGIVGEETWQTLVGASFTLGDRLLYVSRPMMHGDDVRELQRRLNRLGFDCGYDDGLFGPQTFVAVREFQLNAGLLVDGIAGLETIDHLLRLHRAHQEAPVAAVREREALRHPRRRSIAGTRLMIDPGHSVADPGFRSADGVAEHEVTWQIAAALEGRLAALGAHVVLSRGPHTTPSPSQRAAHANAEDVELILSIHLNGVASPQGCGAAAYHFGTEVQISDRGRRLAQLALDAVLAATGTQDCRVHPSTIAILRESRAPAAVIEPGFLTHPEEGRQLGERRIQQRIAGALTEAVTHYLLGDPPSPTSPGTSRTTALSTA
jgi:N-acetylmuramoyl-L-alanine amidase